MGNKSDEKLFKRTISLFLTAILISGTISGTCLADSFTLPKGGFYVIGGGNSVERIESGMVYVITGGGIVSLDVPVVPPEPEYPPPAIDISSVNIGLYYGNDAQPSATIENVVGRGFKFGFYDANRVFYEVGSTSETALTLARDTNVSVSGGELGCYHILLPGTYWSFADALEASRAYDDAFPAYYSGAYFVLAGQYPSYTSALEGVAQRGIGGEAFTASDRCVTVTKTGSTRILFEFDYSTSFSLTVRPVSGDANAQTRLKNHKNDRAFVYYGDFQFARVGGGDMTISNILNIEDYVKGVVPYEMYSTWPLEALKAQAICARTYVAYNLGKHRAHGFDVCDTVECQAYLGTMSATAHTDAAINETAGKYVSYHGELCQTFYSSSDGGATEDSENVFIQALPYCRGVADPYEDALDFYNKSWKYTLSAQQIQDRLTARGYKIAAIVSIEPEYTRMENMASLTFTDVNGKKITITKDQCRTVMELPSINYRLKPSEQKSNSYDIEGGGWGHSVGMSQWGAHAMALEYGKTAEEILKFYYTGVTIG